MENLYTSPHRLFMLWYGKSFRIRADPKCPLHFLCHIFSEWGQFWWVFKGGSWEMWTQFQLLETAPGTQVISQVLGQEKRESQMSWYLHKRTSQARKCSSETITLLLKPSVTSCWGFMFHTEELGTSATVLILTKRGAFHAPTLLSIFFPSTLSHSLCQKLSWFYALSLKTALC